MHKNEGLRHRRVLSDCVVDGKQKEIDIYGRMNGQGKREEWQ